MRTKLTDDIFQRFHSLSPLSDHDERPILMEDNPSRDFVFPASGAALAERCRQLPGGAGDGITHLWLRRVNHRRFAAVPQAEFICGSGVRLIVIYPWRADLLQRLGTRRPSAATLRSFAPWATELRHEGGQWCLVWGRDALERYCLEGLLLHEIGHHLDQQRNRWTAANRRATEARADGYAARWSADGRADVLDLG